MDYKITPHQLKQNWDSRGYTFGIFKDPPGQVWADFVHKTDELVVLAEGEIEIEIEGKSQRPKIGEEVFIPANALHTVRNVGSMGNVWCCVYNLFYEFKNYKFTFIMFSSSVFNFFNSFKKLKNSFSLCFSYMKISINISPELSW